MATLPIQKFGCCWRVGNGSSIRVCWDRWIPNHPTNRILYPSNEDIENWWVSYLIDPDLNWWRQDFIMSMFHGEVAEAICPILLP